MQKSVSTIDGVMLGHFGLRGQDMEKSVSTIDGVVLGYFGLRGQGQGRTAFP